MIHSAASKLLRSPYCWACFISIVFFFSGCTHGGELQVAGLRTEFRENPIGIATAVPRLSWRIRSDGWDVTQTAYRIIAAESEKELAHNRGNLWDSGRVESNHTLDIPYGGIPLDSGHRCFWKVRVWDDREHISQWSDTAFFETALLHTEDWKGIWISDGKPIPQSDAEFYAEDPAPLFRKSFFLDRKPVSARLYISGLGYYESHINGRRVGDQVLDPGWTDYANRILYSTYDIGDMLEAGENCLGVMLGNGWYNPLPLRMWGRLNLREHLALGRPCLIAQLEIYFADGSSKTIITDKSWAVHQGPLLRNNIYLGEEYDARLEIPDWESPGFDDSGWNRAIPAPNPGGRLEAQPQPPIKAAEKIHPIGISAPSPGIYIIDFGENFAGWARIKVKAPSGARIQLRYGELLHPDGTLNPMTSVCGQIKGIRPDGTPVGGPGSPEFAVQKDIYICKGVGEEEYTPTFTFHAFRYMEISGIPSRPELGDIAGFRLQADVESTGSFSCSDPLFNNIQEMTRRTFLSNIFSVQSDCPQRERFGYGGDIAVTSEAFMMNFDMASFYAKAVRDWQDAARPDGMLTDTAPFVGIQYCGVAWAMVHPLLQTQLFQYYGNKRLIEEQYSVSRRWLDLVNTQNPSHIITEGLSDHEGLAPAPAPPMVTPFYAESARLLSRLAELLDLDEDETRYQTLHNEIRKTYLDSFLESGTGQVQPNTQASQAIALGLGLLSQKEQEKAFKVLIRKIQEEKNGHLSTGIYGTRYLLEVLSRAGQADLAASIVRQNTFPGWGHMLENQATTLWEHWELSDNTYSHNHPMFGSVSAWFYQWLAGIQPHPDAEGFDRIIIRPQPVMGLSWVEAEYKSIRGTIHVRWERKEKSFLLKVTIPPNTRAEVFLPTSDISGIYEKEKPPINRSDKLIWEAGKGYAVCQIGSGTYTFIASL